MIEMNKIIFDYMPTTDIVANPLTKGIFEVLFTNHIAHMGLRYV